MPFKRKWYRTSIPCKQHCGYLLHKQTLKTVKSVISAVWTNWIIHPLKFGNKLFMTFIPSFNVFTWKIFSITSVIFNKILSLPWKNKVTENNCFLILYWSEIMERSLYWYLVVRKALFPPYSVEHIPLSPIKMT